MSSVAINESIADALRPWPAKVIAERIRKFVKTSDRTVENWKAKSSTPSAVYISAMLKDDELGAALLAALGRADWATRAQMVSLLKQTQQVIGKASE